MINALHGAAFAFLICGLSIIGTQYVLDNQYEPPQCSNSIFLHNKGWCTK